MSNFPHRDEGPFGCLLLAWLIALVFSLAFWGVVAWAIIELVQYVTAN